MHGILDVVPTNVINTFDSQEIRVEIEVLSSLFNQKLISRSPEENIYINIKSKRRYKVRKGLNSRRAPSPLMRLVGEEERWEATDLHLGVFPQNWGGTKQNRTVICMVLKAKANDRRKNESSF
ncbi:hypothetical protein TNCV_3057981 [Trichonephila clavipes]|nr:hypothetical protein TNCV_3057981 [Trichonephila clavipes]